MKLRSTAVLLSVLVLPLAACGESGQETSNIVQAATKGAAEVGQQIADKTAELARTTPEQAKAKFQEWVDVAARELEAIKDSETAQKLVAKLQEALDQLASLARKLGQKLDLAGLQTKVDEQITRFKTDPRVTGALETLKQKLESFGD